MVSNSKFSIEALKSQDHIGFMTDPSLMALIYGERLLFADLIKKTNMFEWT
jgi:hypothetical protein